MDNIVDRPKNTRVGEEKEQMVGEYALRYELEAHGVYLLRYNYVSQGRKVPPYAILAGIPLARVGGGPLPDAYGPPLVVANSLDEVRAYLDGCERARQVPQEDVIDLTTKGERL